MSASAVLFSLLTLLVLGAALLILVAVVRHTPRGRAADALARGDFGAALAAGAGAAAREDLVPAATAARHLGELETAADLATRATRADPDDGEAWLELGLARGYAGALDEAAAALDRALSARADLAEAVTLHRAWLALRGGERDAARRLFDEVEAPLETKLRLDLGPGDPAFADWFFHAGELWLELGDPDRGRWALREARRSAPGSRLFGAGDPPAL